MNRKQPSVVLAGMLAIALAGCSTFRSSSSDSGTAMSAGSNPASSSMASDSGAGASTSASASTTEGATSTGTSTTGGSSSGSATDTGMQTQAVAPDAAPTHAMPNATVALIESVPRSATTGSSGSSGSGSSGSSGSSGASATESRVYRITLRMDDGTTRVITQDGVPAFRTGDRVNMAAGVINQ